MSILEIGTQSRHLQASPGCRKYINPFLSNSQRQQIQVYREENQAHYREILLQQMKEKERQKLIKKKKQEEEDLKHQRDFYQKIKNYQSRDAQSQSRKNRVVGGSMPRMADNHEAHERNIFRKNAEPSFPPLHSSLIFPESDTNNDRSSIFSPQSYPIESGYLKYNSLMDIGNNIKLGKKMGRSATLQSDQYEFENKKMLKFKERVEKGFHRPEKGYMELKMQLKEQSNEVYELIEKSSQFSKSTKSPIRQIKKRLKTQHVYIPSDDQQDDDTYKKPLRYRIRTQFGTRHGQDYDDLFYRLPSLPSLDWAFSQSNTIGRESAINISQGTNEMMKIQENPQNEFMDDKIEEGKLYEVNNNEYVTQ